MSIKLMMKAKAAAGAQKPVGVGVEVGVLSRQHSGVRISLQGKDYGMDYYCPP
jgi:hypothetical protein